MRKSSGMLLFRIFLAFRNLDIEPSAALLRERKEGMDVGGMKRVYFRVRGGVTLSTAGDEAGE